MDLNQLKDAGFNDQEIKDYVDTESKQLINAGFNNQEVSQYFGVKQMNTTEIKTYWQSIKDSMVQPVVQLGERKEKGIEAVQEGVVKAQEGLIGKEFDFNTYRERGVGGRINSLIDAYNTTGKLPDVYTTSEPEDTGYLEGFIERGYTLFGDLPYYLGGGLLGLAGGPKTAAFTAGLVPGTIRKMYITALEKGDVDTYEEWWKIFVNEGIKAGATEGLQLTAAAVAPQLAGPIGKNFFGKVASQVTAFEGVGSLIKGELPTKDDLVYSTGFFLAFGLGEKGAKKVIEQVKNTGKKPAEIYEDSIVDPTIREDIGSKNIEIARTYESIVEKKAEPVKAAEVTKKDFINEFSSLNNENLNGSIIEKYSYYANKDAGQTIGNREVIVKLNNEYYNKYIKNLSDNIFKIEGDNNFYTYVDKKLIKINENFSNFSKILFEELKNKNIYLKLSSVDNKPFSINEINTLKEIRPKNEYALQVYNFNNKESLIRRSISDSQRNSDQIKLDKENLKIRQLGKSNLTEIKIDDFIQSEKSVDVDVAKVQEKILFDPVEIKTSTKDIINNFTFNWLDKLHPVLRSVREAEKIGVKVQEGILNPYELARLQPGMISRGEHFLKHGTLDFKTLEIKSKPLITILEPITKDISTYKEFSAYAIAKRAIEKSSQGFETGIDIQAAKNTIRKLELKYDEKSNFIPKGIKNTFKELGEYQNNLLKYLKDSGIINEKTFNVMLESNKDYVPFFRVLEDLGKDGSISKSVANPLKRFKGSEKVIVDPIESIYKNTLHFVTLVERNRSLVEFVKMIELSRTIDPKAFPEVSKSKPKLTRTKVTREELENVVTDISKIDSSALEGFEIFRRTQQQLGKNEVAIFRDGKREVWDLGSDLSRSFKHLNETSQKLVSSIISLPSRTLRAGATLAPEFFLKNAIRDTAGGTIFSRNGFVLGLDTARGMMTQILSKYGKENSSKIYQDWIKSGGPQSSYVAFDRNYFSNNISKELTSRPVYNLVKNPLEMLRIATEFFENSTRLGEFQKAYNNSIKKGLNHKQAVERGGFEARNITVDFQKMGAKVGAWNAVSAFFNARVQGYVKLYDTFKNPETRYKALYLSASLITLPSILLWYANHDDERYKELPQWQKDLFWIFITGEGKDTTIWRAPIPFELGFIFKTLPERALDFINKKDPTAIKNLLKDFALDNATSVLPIPDIAKPVIEAWSNKSLFTKKPIVPRSLEGVLPEYQYTEYTSETSKILGKLIRQISGDYSGISSPARIESTINNWTGTLGRTFTTVLDKALIASGIVDDPIKPEETLSDMPIIRAFVVRNPTSGSEYITTFYDKYDKVSKVFNTIDRLQKSGNFEEANKLLVNLPAESTILKSTYKLVQDNEQRVRNIYNSKLFTPNEKRQLIDELYRQMIDISKYSLETIKEIK